jgi:hypothetical protein
MTPVFALGRSYDRLVFDMRKPSSMNLGVGPALCQVTDSAHVIRRQLPSVVFTPLPGHEVAGVVKASTHVHVAWMHTDTMLDIATVDQLCPWRARVLDQFVGDMMCVTNAAFPVDLAVAVGSARKEPQPTRACPVCRVDRTGPSTC